MVGPVGAGMSLMHQGVDNEPFCVPLSSLAHLKPRIPDVALPARGSPLLALEHQSRPGFVREYRIARLACEGSMEAKPDSLETSLTLRRFPG